VVGWFGMYDFASMPKRASPLPGMPAGPSAEDLFLGCPDGNCTAKKFAGVKDGSARKLGGGDDWTATEWAEYEAQVAPLAAKLGYELRG